MLGPPAVGSAVIVSVVVPAPVIYWKLLSDGNHWVEFRFGVVLTPTQYPRTELAPATGSVQLQFIALLEPERTTAEL